MQDLSKPVKRASFNEFKISNIRIRGRSPRKLIIFKRKLIFVRVFPGPDFTQIIRPGPVRLGPGQTG